MRSLGLAVIALVLWTAPASAQWNKQVDLGDEFSKWLHKDDKNSTTSSPPSTNSGGNFFTNLFSSNGSPSTSGPTASSGKPDTSATGDVSTLSGAARADDADFLTITQSNGKPITVRLWGVEAPDTKQWPWGPRARGEVDNLLAASGGAVRCSINGTKIKAGNLIARCYAGDADIAAKLIEGGFGAEWREVSGGTYAQLESDAKTAKRGVWSPQ